MGYFDEFQTSSERQYKQFATELMDKHGAAPDASAARETASSATSITHIESDEADPMSATEQRRRFREIAEAVHRGERPKQSPFRSWDEACVFGHMVIAAMTRDQRLYDQLDKAGISGKDGVSGGFVMTEHMIEGFFSNVEEAGVWERNCPALNVPSMSGGMAGTMQRPQVFFPDYDEAVSLSDVKLQKRRYSCPRWAVAVAIEDWMLTPGQAAVGLAEHVVREMSYAMALKMDTLFFVGSGSAADGRYMGLLNRETLRQCRTVIPPEPASTLMPSSPAIR